jgi:hypothetical protein
MNAVIVIVQHQIFLIISQKVVCRKVVVNVIHPKPRLISFSDGIIGAYTSIQEYRAGQVRVGKVRASSITNSAYPMSDKLLVVATAVVIIGVGVAAIVGADVLHISAESSAILAYVTIYLAEVSTSGHG